MVIEVTLQVMAEHLGVAALIGVAVGTEREWSSPPAGPRRRFAGLRTFLLFGLLGGTAGLFISLDAPVPAAALLLGGALLAVVAYAMAVRRPRQPLDGTTETAALAVLGLGALAGIGELSLAVGSAAVMVFALGEKQRLHWLVRRIGNAEMYAALQFAVLALVILPLLPAGPYPQFWDLRPRSLWAIVLLLMGLNFAGYLARRAAGPARAYAFTGMLGGIASSTAVTFQFSRLSRSDAEDGEALAGGVIAANTVLPVRVTLLSFALNPALGLVVIWYLAPLAAAGIALTAYQLRARSATARPLPEARSPLGFRSAIEMAVLFQLAIIVFGYVYAAWGSTGVMASAVALGLTDADALTVAMSRLTGSADALHLAALGIVVGLLTSIVFKVCVVSALGVRGFRRRVLQGLAVMCCLLVASAWWAWHWVR